MPCGTVLWHAQHSTGRAWVRGIRWRPRIPAKQATTVTHRHAPTWEIVRGDCIQAMKDMTRSGRSFHSIVTDPPFHLTESQRRFVTGNADRPKSAKASKAERMGSGHPTVKPLALVRWLVRMVTPPGGTVLDPFAGTGTTGEAALLEGHSSVLVEMDGQYQEDLVRRMRDVA